MEESIARIPGLISLRRPLMQGIRQRAEDYLARYDGVLADYSWTQFIGLQSCNHLALLESGADLLFLRQGRDSLDLVLPPLIDRSPEHFHSLRRRLVPCLEPGLALRVLNLDPEKFPPQNLAAFPQEADRPDYIYRRDALLAFAGAAYRNRRSDVNRLLRAFPDLQTRWLTADDVPLLLSALDPLLHRPRGPRFDPESFLQATPAQTSFWDRYQTRKLLRCWSEHRARGLALLAWGRPVGLMLATRIGRDVLSVLAGKILPGFDGGLTLMLRQLCEEWPEPCIRVNLADDGGIRGLARLKLDLQPEFLAHRYSLILQTGRGH